MQESRTLFRSPSPLIHSHRREVTPHSHPESSTRMATAAPVKPAFRPFVPATESRPELTIRALLLGVVFGVLFGAVTVYVGLRAGLTVAASIPISVLSISIMRYISRVFGLRDASILEN